MLPTLLVLEDLTAEAGEKRSWDSPTGTMPLEELMFMGQGMQIWVFWVTHTLKVSEKMLKNTQSVYFFGLQGEDPRKIQHLLGTITPEQTDKARILQRGEFVALIPSRWPRPVYATFEERRMPRDLTEAERRGSAQAFLSRVIAVKAKGPDCDERTSPSEETVPAGTRPEGIDTTSSKMEVSPRGIEALTHSCTGKIKSLGMIYDSMNVSTTQGGRASKKLRDRGLWKTPAFSTGKPGGKIKIPFGTELGRTELKKRGIEPRPHRIQGGDEHNIGATLIGDAGRQAGKKVEYEVCLDGARLDVVWMDKTSDDRTHFNVGVSDPIREAENALRIIQQPVVADNSFVFVARDTAFKKKFEAALAKKGFDSEGPQGIEIMLITDFLDVQGG